MKFSVTLNFFLDKICYFWYFYQKWADGAQKMKTQNSPHTPLMEKGMENQLIGVK